MACGLQSNVLGDWHASPAASNAQLPCTPAFFRISHKVHCPAHTLASAERAAAMLESCLWPFQTYQRLWDSGSDWVVAIFEFKPQCEVYMMASRVVVLVR